jgi:uncharacterized protein (DUF305 family)
MKTIIFAAAVLFTGIGAASAQDQTAPDLPAICLKDAGHGGMAMPMGAAGADEAHTALMAGMDKMNADMMAGGTARDLDVAFICSMIPHHRGAIDMAKAELQYGDDEWAKTLAQQVIAAQEKEIAEMLEWLEKQPQ